MSGGKKNPEETKTEGLGVTPQEADDDDFGAAFEEATDESSDSKTKAEALEKERAEEKEEDEDGNGKEDNDNAGGKTKAGKEPIETDDDKKGKKEEPEDWEQKYKSLQGIVKGLQDENETLKKGKDDPGKKSEDDKKPAGIDLAKLAEDNPVIKEFVEEYDYLVEPFQAILSQVASNRSSVSPEDLAFIHHSATITAAHPEYPRISQLNDKGESELKTFVQNYAGDDKERIEDAYEKGSTAEVIWLIDQFKTSKKGPNDGKKKKLEDLSAVESKRSAVNPKAKDDGDDSFEAGFDAATRKK